MAGRAASEVSTNRKIAIVALALGAVYASGGFAGCSCTRPDWVEKERRMVEKTIEQVQEEHTDAWMAIPGVVGTAIGLHEGKPCIMVLTATDTESVKEQIPSTVEGYPVVVQYTGEIRALDEQ